MSKKKVASGLMRVRLQLTFNNGQLELVGEDLDGKSRSRKGEGRHVECSKDFED
jgi:hypothetical protein